MSTSAEEAYRRYSERTGVAKFIQGTRDANDERAAFLAGWEAHERKHIEEHKETLIAWQEQQEKL